MSERNDVVYREVQKPRSVLLWVFVSSFSVFIWYQFIQQVILGIPVGNNPASDTALIAIWLVFGVVFPMVLLFFSKLIIEVREDGVYIRYMPFHFRYKPFLFKDIEHYESITYSPMKHFGGWGIRINFHGEMAYNLSGKKAIKLVVKGQPYVIGSRKPDELKKAMDLAK